MRKKQYLIGLFLIGFFIFSMALGTQSVLADEGETDKDDNGVDDNKEEWNERDVNVEDDDDSVKITSRLKNGDKKDEFTLKIDFDGEDGLQIKVQFELDSEGEVDDNNDEKEDKILFESEDESEDEFELESEDETEDEIEFQINFQDIIEYVDINGNGLYDSSADEEIQIYEIGKVGWDSPDYSKKELDDGSILHKINIGTADGIFTVKVYVVEGFEEVSGSMIAPTEAKIDIIIENFNYINDSSQLALYIKLQSEEYEEEDETEDEDEGYGEDEKGVKTKGDIEGIFTWADTADVDGVSQPVLVNAKETDHEDEDGEKIYFNYKRGTKIVHDPKIGIAGVLQTSEPLNLPLIIAIVAGVIGAAAATMVAIKVVRKRKAARVIMD